MVNPVRLFKSLFCGDIVFMISLVLIPKDIVNKSANGLG